MSKVKSLFSRATPAVDVTKLKPGIALPHVTLPTTEGGRVELGAPTGRWQMIVVYRGKHDPLCVTYLAALQVDDLRGAVLAVSPDTRAGRIGFKVAYGLNEEQMRRWGLYVSHPLGTEESGGSFSGDTEPALFLVNPAGLVHVLVYSNATFARPDLKQIVQGIKMVQDRKLPIRGTLY
eukprot:scaffold1.g5179.t1